MFRLLAYEASVGKRSKDRVPFVIRARKAGYRFEGGRSSADQRLCLRVVRVAEVGKRRSVCAVTSEEFVKFRQI
jgi:hypothetical protein